jgi:hypothetical protein
VFKGHVPYVVEEVKIPNVELLPPAERRRTGPPIKLALCVGLEALADSTRSPQTVATVFTSSGGDGAVIHDICQTLATEQRELSPTRFHNSVHNAPAGYWGIALRAQAPSTSLCAYDWSFATGLLEAFAQVSSEHEAVLLISYDLPYPEPLHAARPILGTFGCALLLSREKTDRCKALLNIALSPQSCQPTRMQHPELEAFRGANPTGRALPILHALATGSSTDISLDHQGGSVIVKVQAHRSA